MELNSRRVFLSSFLSWAGISHRKKLLGAGKSLNQIGNKTSSEFLTPIVQSLRQIVDADHRLADHPHPPPAKLPRPCVRILLAEADVRIPRMTLLLFLLMFHPLRTAEVRRDRKWRRLCVLARLDLRVFAYFWHYCEKNANIYSANAKCKFVSLLLSIT
jgi:hypothetical protein